MTRRARAQRAHRVEQLGLHVLAGHSRTRLPPAASAASTRSSPSAANSPSFVAPALLRWSLRMVLSLSLSAEVIMEQKGRLVGRPGECSVSASPKRPPPPGLSRQNVGTSRGRARRCRRAPCGRARSGQLQAVHELAVRHALLARGGVDARDPEAAEVALLVAAVAVGVGVGLEQGFLGPLVARLRLAAVALGPLERGAALLARVD